MSDAMYCADVRRPTSDVPKSTLHGHTYELVLSLRVRVFLEYAQSYVLCIYVFLRARYQ